MALSHLLPQEIKACLKRLPTKEEVARWRAEQTAAPSHGQEEAQTQLNQPEVTEAP